MGRGRKIRREHEGREVEKGKRGGDTKTAGFSRADPAVSVGFSIWTAARYQVMNPAMPLSPASAAKAGNPKAYWTPLRPRLLWLARLLGGILVVAFLVQGFSDGAWHWLTLGHGLMWLVLGFSRPAFRRGGK
jgi:hypothetical protein